MIQSLNDPVSVILKSSHKDRSITPTSIEWSGRIYPILKVGLRHKYRNGNTLHHVFSVVSNSLFFRLNLNTDTLLWNLEEISDGLPD